MSDDFDDFKTVDGGEPTDGIHTARLERASVLDTRNGMRIKIDWRTHDGEHYWEAWHGISGRAKPLTQAVLAGIGIQIEELSSWDELGDELADAEGGLFEVRVERNGNFLNTYIEGKPQGVQESLDAIPVDTRDFEPAVAPAGDDDDIPF